MSVQPAEVTFQSKWTALNGAGYGVKQGVMLGSMRVTLHEAFPLDSLEALMARFVDESAPARVGREEPESYLVDRLLYWHAAIQRQQRIPVFGPHHQHIVPRSQPGISPGNGSQSSKNQRDGGQELFLAIPCFDKQATSLAMNWVFRLAGALSRKPVLSPDVLAAHQQSFERLMSGLSKFTLTGVNNFHFLNAAHGLDIPWHSIFPGTFSYGMGCRSHVMRSSATDQTSYIGVQFANRKTHTAYILRQQGIPVPRHAPVHSEEEALQLAEQYGYPVVIKPEDQEQGLGVSANLKNSDSVRAAYQSALKHSSRILLEQHYPGEDYRLTVFRGKVVKILLRRPGGVMGDGHHSVDELLDIELQTPRFLKYYRRNGRQLMTMDEEASGLLVEQGLSGTSIPAEGQFVVLRRKSNISAGGIQTLVKPEDAHPDNLTLAIRATRAMYLDLGGVDLLIPDIARSWLETGAVILEMNATPQIGIDLEPTVYADILETLLEGNGRIPVHLVICAGDSDCPDEAEARQWMLAQGCNGFSTRRGVWVEQQQLTAPLGHSFDAARILLTDYATTGALCIMTAADIVKYGLPTDRFASVRVLGSESAVGEDRRLLARALQMVDKHSLRPVAAIADSLA